MPETEKQRRIYYQDIVYAVCGALDDIDHNHISQGTGIVCGTADEPSTQVQDRVEQLVGREDKLTRISRAIKEIIVTEGEDTGVILLSTDSPTRYDPELQCHIYEHENFSPLGDALVSLWHLTQGN